MNRDSQTTASRVGRRRQDARARITQAAATLFARNGFAETSMAGIAAEADVAVGTLYSFFDGKDALYRELIHTKAVEFHRRLIAPLEAPGTPRENLDAYFEEMLSLYRDEAVFIRFYLHMFGNARLSLRASFSDDTRAIYDDVLGRLSALIERGAAEGSFVDIADAPRTATALQAAAVELFLLHLDSPDQHPAGAVLAELKRILDSRMQPLSRHGSAGQTDRAKEQP